MFYLFVKVWDKKRSHSSCWRVSVNTCSQSLLLLGYFWCIRFESLKISAADIIYMYQSKIRRVEQVIKMCIFAALGCARSGPQGVCTAVTGQIEVPYLALDSVCKPLVSTDQFDQRALALKRSLLRSLMNEDLVSPNSQAPIFTTSHRSPRPLSITTCTNWADYCKMCVLVCVAKPVCWGGGGIGAFIL